jgi:hypothetical protein
MDNWSDILKVDEITVENMYDILRWLEQAPDLDLVNRVLKKMRYNFDIKKWAKEMDNASEYDFEGELGTKARVEFLIREGIEPTEADMRGSGLSRESIDALSERTDVDADPYKRF